MELEIRLRTLHEDISRTIQVNPKYHHNCPYKRKRETGYTQRGGRDRSDTVTSQGVPASPGAREARNRSFPELQKGHSHSYTLFQTSGLQNCQRINVKLGEIQIGITGN